jgi:two-component system KDP operon response regulator KdpE
MTEAPHAILVIEDEPQIRRFLGSSLRASGYRVIEAESGARGLIEAGSHKPDLVLLDLGLPDMDGVELVRRLRTWASLPILILSARTEETQKIAALDAGADDYVTKPFAVGELLARIRVALRHAARPPGSAECIVSLGEITVDLERRTARGPAVEIHLTPTEFRLLAALARHDGMVVTQRQLLKEVWGPSHVEQPHYLRVYMKQLRDKLEPEPARPQYLLTETGVGYRLRLE